MDDNKGYIVIGRFLVVPDSDWPDVDDSANGLLKFLCDSVAQDRRYWGSGSLGLLAIEVFATLEAAKAVMASLPRVTRDAVDAYYFLEYENISQIHDLMYRRHVPSISHT